MPIPKKRKLGPKTVDCVNLGYAKNSVGYRFLVVKYEVPNVNVSTIIVSKDATFFEDIFPMRDMQALLDRNLMRLLNLPFRWNIMNKHMMKILRRMMRNPR